MNTFKIFKRLGLGILLCLLLVTFVGAKRSQNRKPRLLPLTSVHIIDRNGFSETISNKERLNQFQNVNFLSQQPYQKVLRIYARDSMGNIRSVVTTYHENGNPKQFLEILNARANGSYCEWHENGKMSVMAHVIGGVADVTSMAEKSWLFDGMSYAWDEEEHQIAEINYSQGSLEGTTTYFHSNGQIWKHLPYVKNQLEGSVEIYRSNRELLQQLSYCQGQKHGLSLRYWDCQQLASQEEYCRGKLENGDFFDKQGNLIAQVKNGTGFRAIFGKDHVQELQEFVDGSLEGEVKVFNQEGHLKRIYHVKNDIKHGEEIEYYDRFFAASASPQPKLSFYWYEGKIQGMVKTWYSTGILESQKEMANNAKNGVLTAWYRDGNLMMIEEYDNDKLLRGDYFKKEEKTPVSQIIDGKGIATIFDADGHFVQKFHISMASRKFDSPDSLAGVKQKAAAAFKKIRQALSVDRQLQASSQAYQKLCHTCQSAKYVLSFASFGSEINLWPFNEELATEGRLVLPLMIANQELQLFQVTHFSQLERHRMGILEPKRSDCKPVDISLVEIALIPGLGFDLKTHYRLGYGRGYYDRLLASTADGMQAWGVGFLEQAVENLPYSKHDIPLNQIYLF